MGLFGQFKADRPRREPLPLKGGPRGYGGAGPPCNMERSSELMAGIRGMSAIARISGVFDASRPRFI